MKLPIAISVAVISLQISGCSNMGPNQSTGTVVGALGGAAIGAGISHNGVGAAVGALGGAIIGNAIGDSMDD